MNNDQNHSEQIERLYLEDRITSFDRFLGKMVGICSFILIVHLISNVALRVGQKLQKSEISNGASDILKVVIFQLYNSFFDLLPIFFLIFVIASLVGSFLFFRPGNLAGLLIIFLTTSSIIMIITLITSKMAGAGKPPGEQFFYPSVAMLVFAGGFGIIPFLYLIKKNVPAIFINQNTETDHLFYLLEMRDVTELGDFQQLYRLKLRSLTTGNFVALLISYILVLIYYIPRQYYIVFIISLAFALGFAYKYVGWEKAKLALFCFLSPSSGSDLYRISHLKTRRDMTSVQKEHDQEIIALISHYDNNKLESRRYEFVRHIFTKLSQKRNRWLKQIIEDVEKGYISIKDGFQKITEMDKAQLKLDEIDLSVYAPEPVLSKVDVPPDSRPALSIKDKLANLSGLSVDEIKVAVKDGLIDRNQAHLWSEPNIETINLALEDFDLDQIERVCEYICFPKSFNYPPRTGQFLINKFNEAYNAIAEGGRPLSKIKGMRAGFCAFEFTTNRKRYTAVLRKIDSDECADGKYFVLVLGIFECPFFDRAEPNRSVKMPKYESSAIPRHPRGKTGREEPELSFMRSPGDGNN